MREKWLKNAKTKQKRFQTIFFFVLNVGQHNVYLICFNFFKIKNTYTNFLIDNRRKSMNIVNGGRLTKIIFFSFFVWLCVNYAQFFLTQNENLLIVRMVRILINITSI